LKSRQGTAKLMGRTTFVLVREQARHVTQHYCLFDTAIGPCGIAWDARGMTRLQLPERDRAATERRLRARLPNAVLAAPVDFASETIGQVQLYLTGKRVDFSSVGIDLRKESPFAQAVYAAARSVGWGQTSTYGELAGRAGSPEMARDVGQAMSRNPVPIIIPCHRILAAGRKLGGFSAHGGSATKQRLLMLEGVHIGGDAPRLPGI
jgi:methylated-DNA-[protein]-cysteine S-methyltransferase